MSALDLYESLNYLAVTVREMGGQGAVEVRVPKFVMDQVALDLTKMSSNVFRLSDRRPWKPGDAITLNTSAGPVVLTSIPEDPAPLPAA